MIEREWFSAGVAEGAVVLTALLAAVTQFAERPLRKFQPIPETSFLLYAIGSALLGWECQSALRASSKGKGSGCGPSLSRFARIWPGANS
jgi:hypothetical protein